MKNISIFFSFFFVVRSRGSTRVAKNAARAYTRALGELLPGNRDAARKDLKRCLELKNDHLGAKTVLEMF